MERQGAEVGATWICKPSGLNPKGKVVASIYKDFFEMAMRRDGAPRGLAPAIGESRFEAASGMP